MGATNPEAGTAAVADESPGRDPALTRRLLLAGILAGPFYLTLGLAQALVRDGFDLSRHALSLLANGPGGWVQSANFIITGLLVLAAAAGFNRVPGRKPRAMSAFLGVFGASMIAAAIFPADPVAGFPPGTPEGMPASISTTGLLHFVAGALGFLALALSGLSAAPAMARRKVPALAWLSAAAGIAVLLGFFGGAILAAGSAGILGIWFAVVAGWAWLAVLALHFHRRLSARDSVVSSP